MLLCSCTVHCVSGLVLKSRVVCRRIQTMAVRYIRCAAAVWGVWSTGHCWRSCRTCLYWLLSTVPETGIQNPRIHNPQSTIQNPQSSEYHCIWVAVGKGELSFELLNLNGVQSTVIDPRVVITKTFVQKLQKVFLSAGRAYCPSVCLSVRLSV